MIYKLCVISKKVLHTTVVEELYLPAEYAQVGKTINIRIGGEWDYGWSIDAVKNLNIQKLIESKDINTGAKPAEKIYRSSVDKTGLPRKSTYTPAFTPRDKDHQ